MAKTMDTCPKCGNDNDLLSVECSKCGIIFSRYYEIQARDETDKEKKEELLIKQKEEEEKAEAIRKQREEEERRAEALRKQREEERKAELSRQEQEEEERRDELSRQEQEEEERKAEALRQEREEEERKVEALRQEREEEERKIEALRQEQEEEERKIEALRKQQEEERKELQKRIEGIKEELQPKPKIKDLLKKYEGQIIGINYDSPTEIKGANLVKVGDDLFSILITDDELMKSYPLRNIMSIVEGVNGVSTGNVEERSPFSIVIQVYHPTL